MGNCIGLFGTAEDVIRFKEKDFAVLCNSEQNVKAFLGFCEGLGIKWSGGAEISEFDRYNKDCCVFFCKLNRFEHYYSLTWGTKAYLMGNSCARNYMIFECMNRTQQKAEV